MKNLQEFKNLIERYETITLDEIKEEWKRQSSPNGFIVAQKLTGFGSGSTCTLCIAVKTDFIRCGDCVYGISYGCISGENEISYNKIDDAETPRQLRNAFRNRAKYLKETYKQIL